MNNQDCHCDLLANSDVGQVKICPDCGQVHLALQYVTLRFEMDAFRSLAVMVSQAQYRIDSVMANKTDAASVALSGGLH